jgi:dATP pyrophosphohydrolase
MEIPVRCGAVSVFVLSYAEGSSRVLLLRRTGTLRGEWCQVAGAIEAGETAWQAALREVEEETGLRPLVPPEGPVTLNHEHSEFRWLDWDDAAALVPFAGQRNVLRHVEREFGARPDERLRIA